ncbi:MAG: hypothetical protein M1150_03165 [Patescibacteria group bacterium]|nr:hypothetical protein [Patescibacteria group bacterium]
MEYLISTKKFQLSDSSLRYLDRKLKRLSRFLSDMAIDLPLLEIIIRKHKKRRLDHILENVSVDPEVNIVSVTPKSSSPVYYDGTMRLQLPKKPIVAHFDGKTVDEALEVGFKRLTRELDTYKGEHFGSDSEYFDQKTIRKLGI